MSRERKRQVWSASVAGDVTPPIPDPEYLRTARKVLFKKTELTVNGVVARRRRIDHYMRHLAQEATRQKRSAQREIRKLREIRRLARPVRRGTRAPSPISATLEERESLSRNIYKMFWPIAFGLWPGITAQFEAVYGDLGDTTKVLPEYMRSDPSLAEFERALKTIRRKRAKGRPYEVGRGKTPTSTRFAKGRSGNPRGRPKSKDPFDTLEKSLSEKVSVRKADGSTTDMPRMEAALTQLWTGAMQGEPHARSELRELIKTLHLQDLLTALPRPPKAAVAGASEKTLLTGCTTVLVRMFERELVGRFTAKYGPVPAFTTSFGRRFPALHEINGLAAVLEERRRAGKPIAVLEDAISPSSADGSQAGRDHPPDLFADRTNSRAAVIDAELDVEWQLANGGSGAVDEPDEESSPATAPVIPTRKRTRAVLPARDKPAASSSSAHPTLLRAKVPIVGASATGKPKPGTSGRKPRS